MKKTRIILDNAGGITLQINNWAHYYNGCESQLADDLKAWTYTRDTSDWDGHDDDALDLEPTQDELQNGGYRIIELYGDDTLEEITERLDDSAGGRSCELLVEALRKLI
jgi:hypothetical protein